MQHPGILENFTKMDNLPTLPGIALEILEAVRSEETSLNKIGDILSKDPPLTVKILGLINSAFYSLPTKVTSISHAVKLLGIDTVKKVALSFSLVRSFSKEKSGLFNYGEFWRNSLLTAVSSRLIAEKVLPAWGEDAFTLGLLQDIGILAFNEAMPKPYSLVLQEREKSFCPYQEAEDRIIGFNHMDLGSFLAQKWGLPDKFYGPIQAHHCPEKALPSAPESVEITRVLFLASLIVDFFNVPEKKIPLGMLEFHLQNFGSGTRIVPVELIEQIHEQTRAISGLFEISLQEDEYLTIIDEARTALIDLSNQAILELVKQQQQIGTLQEQATRDSLTNLYNYRSFHDLLQKEWERTRQADLPLTVVIGDIDFFKIVNDTFGHPAGDFVLASLAKLLSQLLRSSDILARHGGEEFGLALPGIPMENAMMVVGRLRKTIESSNFEFEGRKITLTMSFGVAFLPPGSQVHKDDLIKMADTALYQAKETGRNKVCLWLAEDPQPKEAS
jgi:two-component system cell cycle response regulator